MTSDQFNLDAAALHAAASDPGAATPDVFAGANAELERAERAYRDAVKTRHDLIRQARAVRVPYVALARWTGMNTRTLHEIVEAER